MFICLFIEKSGFSRFFSKKSPSTQTADQASSVQDTPPAAAPAPKQVKNVKVKKIANNAIVVHLSGLAQEPTPSTTEPRYCRACGAAISFLSSTRVVKTGETVTWNW